MYRRIYIWFAACLSLVALVGLSLPLFAQPTTLESDGLTGWYTDLVLTDDNRPLVSYYNNTTGSLHLLICDDLQCLNPTFATIDNSAPDVGRWTALALTPDGRPVITYRDHTNGNLKLARCDDDVACANPDIYILAGRGADAGWHSDIAIDSFNQALVVYRDDTNAPNNTVNFITCELDDTPITCGAPQVVNTVGEFGGFNYLTLGTGGFITHEYHDLANTYFTVYTRVGAGGGFIYTPDSTTISDTAPTWFIDGALPPDTVSPRRAVRVGYQQAGQPSGTDGGLTFFECDDYVNGMVECSALQNEKDLSSANAGLYPEVMYNGANAVIYFQDNDLGFLAQRSCTDPYCNIAVTPLAIDSAGNPGEYLSGQPGPQGTPVLSYADDANDDLRLYRAMTGGDPLPEVAETEPRDGQGAVAIVGAPISITFTEPVDLAPNAISVSCTGGYSFTQTNALTLNTPPYRYQTPNLPADASGTCTVDVDHTLVTDTSSANDQMPFPYTFRFSTQPINLASTVPAENAVVQPHTRLTVNYTGLVQLATSDVTLTCNSNPLAFTGLFGIQQDTISLTPIEPLPVGASCTLTIRTDPADGGNALDASSSIPYERDAYKLGVPDVPFDRTPGLLDLGTSLDTAFATTDVNFTVASGANEITCYATPDDGVTVFSSTDSSAVQQAVNAANAGDTVKIAGTCIGSAEYGQIGDSAVDDTELLFVDKALTLEGGYDLTTLNLQNPAAWTQQTTSFSTLDAASTGRVALFTSAAAVTMRDLILQNGAANYGAGFYNAGGTLTLDNVRVQRNVANLAGGGFFNADGVVSVHNNSVIGGEQGGTGNRVVCDAACQSASNFPSLPDGSGGGFFTTGANASITIDDSAISGNRVQDESALPLGFGGGFAQSNEGSVTIQNSASIGGGTAARGNEADDGAGFVNTGGTVTLFDSTVSHNVAHATGAGFLNAAESPSLATTLILDNSHISDNTNFGSFGGGGFNNATLEVRNGSLFENNQATNAGGLYISNLFNTTTIIDNSIFRNNGTDPDNNSVFDGDGGAIYNDNLQGVGLFIRNNTRIEDNSALLGGGLYNRYVFGTVNPVTVENSSITGNAATENGGGVYNDGGTVTLDNTQVQSNTADKDGGGLHNINTGTITIQNGSTIGGIQGSTGNTADNGAGVYNSADITLDASTVSGNAATGNGGGIANQGGTLEVLNGSIIGGTQGSTGNTADNGAGVHNSADMTLDASTISGNAATSDGGGLYNAAGSVSTQNSTIGGEPGTTGNDAGNSGGGIHNRSALTIEGSAITGNTADSGGGLAQDQDGPTSSTISNSRITGNTSNTIGGGIRALGAAITMSGSEVSDNTAMRAGGIFAAESAPLTITNSTIAHNTAEETGGIFTTSQTNITNSTIGGNTATVGNSGALEVSQSLTTTLNYVTIVNNSAVGVGDGIRLDDTQGATLNIADSIIADNNDNNCTGNISDNGGNYTDDITGCPGTFNVDTDLIVDNGSNNGLLAPLSPNPPGNTPTYALLGTNNANNANNAVDGALPFTQPASDQRGFPRPQGAGRDAGAYEQGAQCFAFDGVTQYQSAHAAAIQQAVNANPTGAVIRIAGYCAGVDDQDSASGSETVLLDNATYTLWGGFDPSPAINGTGSIAWSTPTGATTVLDAQNNGRVAYISATASVTFDALTLRNGTVLNANGGGVYNAGTLTLDNSSVQASTAAEGAGGGLYNTGTLTVQNNSIIGGDQTLSTGNRALCSTCAGNAGAGGGIASVGTLTIDNSNVSGNAATRRGGGVLDVSNNLMVRNNSVIGGIFGTTGNVAQAGAGLYVNDATISNSAISGNDGQGFYGNGTLTLTNVDISDNHAAFNAGFGVEDSSITLTDSRITGNRATGDSTQSAFGGGFGVSGNAASTVILDNTSVENNIAAASITLSEPSRGGGFYNDKSGNIEIRNGSIVRNNRAEQGGGFYSRYEDNTLPRTTVTLNASILRNNTTDVDNDGAADGDGGGFFNAAGGLVQIQNGSVIGGDQTQANIADSGAGFYSAGVDDTGTVFSEVVIDASTVSGNAAEGDGGGFWNGGNGTVTIQNGSLIGGTQGSTGNTAFQGAGFFNDSRDLNDPNNDAIGDTPGSLTIIDASTVSGNVAQSGGGGGYSRAATIVRNNSIIGGVLDFTGNQAAVGAGLININTAGTGNQGSSISATRVIGNRAASSGGGGLIIGGPNVTNSLTNVEISDNRADVNGGGYIINLTTMDMANVTISGNTANNRGGGIYSLSENVRADYVTVVDNSAPNGAGVFAFSGQNVNPNSVDFANSIIAHNNGDNCGVGGAVPTQPGVIIDRGGNYTDDATGCPATFNVDSGQTVGNLLSPLANNGGFSHTHALLAGNPAIDGAITSTSPQPMSDQRGQPRPATIGGAPDAGAYEDSGIAGGSSVLIIGGFDALADHIRRGQTEVRVTILEEQPDTGTSITHSAAADEMGTRLRLDAGNAFTGTLDVYYSTDAICASADDVLLGSISYDFVDGSTTVSAMLDVPRALLWQNAANADQTGPDSISQEVAYLCVGFTDAINSEGLLLNAESGKLRVADDITYFPWDANSDGAITPVDAIGAINALNTANSNYDFDGNGIVTPNEAISTLLRLGELRNGAVMEGDETDTDTGTAADTPLPVPGR